MTGPLGQQTTPKGLLVNHLAGDPSYSQRAQANIEIQDNYAYEQFAWDKPYSFSLVFAYKGGVVTPGGVVTRISDGTVRLADDDVNYVERDLDGNVSVNQTGFSSDMSPMAKVTTRDGVIEEVEDWRLPTGTTVDGGFSGTIDADQITSGILPMERGGTDQGSNVLGDLLVGTGVGWLRKAAVVAGAVLLSAGVGTPGIPAWGQIGNAHVAVGAGIQLLKLEAPTQGDLMYGNATPEWTGLAIGSAGKVLRSTGTLPSWSTSTFADTYAQGTVLYAGTANTVTGLAAGANATYLRSNGTVPAWATISATEITTGNLPYAQLPSGGGTWANGGALSITGGVTTVAGLTSSALVLTTASSSGTSGFRLPHGTAPSSPVNGDTWTTTAGAFVQINGSTVGPLGTGGGVAGAGSAGRVARWSGAASLDNSSIRDAGTGQIGVGGAGTTSTAITVVSFLSGAGAQEAINLAPTFDSSATTSGAGWLSQLATTAAAFTMTNLYQIRLLDVALGAGSAVTTQYGLRVENLTAAATNYAIYTGTGLVRFGDVVTADAGMAVNGGNITLESGASRNVVNVRRIVADSTDFAINNHANTQNNLLVTDAGAVTIGFGSLTVNGVNPGANDTYSLGTAGTGWRTLRVQHGPGRTTGVELVSTTAAAIPPSLMWENTTSWAGNGVAIYNSATNTLAFTTGATAGSSRGTSRMTLDDTVLAVQPTAITGTALLTVGNGATTEAQNTVLRLRMGTNAGANDKDTRVAYFRSSTELWSHGVYGSLASDHWLLRDIVNGVNVINATPGATPLLTLSATTTVSGTLTVTGLLSTAASASGGAGLRLPHGTAPSAPVDGDAWTTTAGAFIRINGTTKEIVLV